MIFMYFMLLNVFYSQLFDDASTCSAGRYDGQGSGTGTINTALDRHSSSSSIIKIKFV